MRRAVAIGALGALDAAAIGTLRPSATLLTDLAHPHRWVAAAGADAAAVQLAAAALWLVACWLGFGLLAGTIGAVPGATGRLAARVARVALPAAIYRAVAGATGLGLLLGPVAASATTPGSGAPAGRSVSGPSAVAPGWPVDDAQHVPGWPVQPPHRHRTPPEKRTPSKHPATPKQTAAERVVVAPGDTLWQIAAERLPRSAGPARIAREWPRWFAANSRVIGANPNLIRPGEVLHAPASHSAPEGPRS